MFKWITRRVADAVIAGFRLAVEELHIDQPTDEELQVELRDELLDDETNANGCLTNGKSRGRGRKAVKS